MIEGHGAQCDGGIFSGIHAVAGVSTDASSTGATVSSKAMAEEEKDTAGAEEAVSVELMADSMGSDGDPCEEEQIMLPWPLLKLLRLLYFRFHDCSRSCCYCW